MAAPGLERVEFGWQGIVLRVPEEWNLGRVDGTYKSGYARLDDAQIVRAEIEWREGGSARGRPAVSALVDRYLQNLEKKAAKTGTSFSVKRRAGFLQDEQWLEGSDYESFLWEADYRAYNLARICPDCGRVILLRVLSHLEGDDVGDTVQSVFSSLQDHPHDDQVFWSVYGLSFLMPADYTLSQHELKSGHIQLSFEKGKQVCRVQRVSLARMLLKHTDLEHWYPVFFKKQLKDLNIETFEEEVRGHPGLRVAGRPRSRWRQLVRPLPLVSPRPRQYLDNRIWHCAAADKICIVDHLYRRQADADDLAQRVTDGYICHQEQAETDARGHAGLAAGAE